MPVRVFVPDASSAGQQLPLPPDEAAHVQRVLRLTAGDALHVFNGRGGEWEALIAESTRAHVRVTTGSAVVPAVETRVRYTVAMAVLKGDGTDEAVRDAVMMGASVLRPFVSARSEVRLEAVLRSRRLDRWQRVAVASAKQCGRAVVPEIAPPAEFTALPPEAAGGVRLMLVEPSLTRATVALTSMPAPAAVTLAAGPEGGWTPDEVAQAAADGWTFVALGGRTLRATAAPIVAMAACQAVWRDP